MTPNAPRRILPGTVETLIGVFRCALPVRYWQEMRRGALLSVFATAGVGVWVGLSGFFEQARKAGEEAARLALAVGAPGGSAPGTDQTAQVAAALQSTALVPFAFFLFTPQGWLADYLVLSAVYRGITLAVDHPRGDPVLTAIDRLVRGWRTSRQARRDAEAREEAEGPAVPDEILASREFAGKETEFVVISSRRKEGWTAATTVIAGSVRLRLGEPAEKIIKGRLRTCYPLSIIRDIQVDRRIVHYEWPRGAPALPDRISESEG